MKQKDSAMKQELQKKFQTGDYALVFDKLWKLGIRAFIEYGEKSKKKKINWFVHPPAAAVFWGKFILQDKVLKTIMESDFADQIFYNYFTRLEKQYPEFEEKCASEYPALYIKAVRVNMAFVDKKRLEFLLDEIELAPPFLIHKKIWKFLQKQDKTLWQEIEQAFGKLKKYTISEILCYMVIALENKRFASPDKAAVHRLANAYSLFVELLFEKYDEKIQPVTAIQFGACFNKCIAVFDDNNVISRLLNALEDWVHFRDTLLFPYCFDLNINPVQENEMIYFQSSPEAWYQWKLDGARYELTKTVYKGKCMEWVEEQEKADPLFIPEGSTLEDKAINGDLKSLECAIGVLLQHLCLDFFYVEGKEIETVKVLQPLLAYSINREHRYENNLKQFSQQSKNWLEALAKLKMWSIQNDIVVDPYFYMSTEAYRVLNDHALDGLPADTTDFIVKILSYEKDPYWSFNRFDCKYNVWNIPFINLGDYHFCPMLFFASNHWFYPFAQAALKLQKFKKSNYEETTKMEEYLGAAFARRGWEVKVFDNKEQNNVDGDVDIIVDDEHTTLFIQLKRTYFRLNLKESYNEFLKTDKSAARQINDAENFFRETSSYYTIKRTPVKWVVTTSFENTNQEIDGCRKVNYLDIVFALFHLKDLSLQEFISFLETDSHIKHVAQSSQGVAPVMMQPFFEKSGLPLQLFESVKYRQLIFSEDDFKTKEYTRLYQKALELDKKGKKEKAMNLFKKCIDFQPENSDPYVALANTLVDFGDYENALLYFKKALEIIPDDPYVCRNCIIAMLQSGKVYEGLKLALRMYKKYPCLGDFYLLFGANFENCCRFLDVKQIKYLNKELDSLVI